MIIGVPKEIKNNENRVGMTPCRSSRIGEKKVIRCMCKPQQA